MITYKVVDKEQRTCNLCSKSNNDGTCNECAGNNYGFTTEISDKGSCTNWSSKQEKIGTKKEKQ